MCRVRFFKEKRLGGNDRVQGGKPSNAKREEETRNITEIINDLYDELLKFDLTYEQLYKMTIKELIKTLEQRKKGLAYKVWKEANLIGASFGENDFPNNPESACPELYPPKISIKMPDFLKEKWLKKGGR